MTALNILIVEDESLVAWDIKNQLAKAGYNVVAICNNGSEALDIFQKKNVDLVMLDIHIRGDMDGIDVAIAIRAVSDIPLIFLTAMSGKSFIDRAKTVQPSAYLLKPYQNQALPIAVDMAISNFMAQKTVAVVPTKNEVPQREDAENNEEKNQSAEAKMAREVFLVQQDFAIVKHQKTFVKVPIKDILYLESEHIYTKIFGVNATYVVRISLQNVLEKLKNLPFLQIHRSFVVHLPLVERFDENNIYIHKKSLPISKTYQDVFLKEIIK